MQTSDRAHCACFPLHRSPIAEADKKFECGIEEKARTPEHYNVAGTSVN
jgi:hypothetical protein